MAHHLMLGPDPEKSASSGTGDARAKSSVPEQFETPASESDFANLAAKLAASAGAGLSAEESAQLALEIVFNQIVEQARLATGADGAAIILKQEGEMICRASTGEPAPALGSRMDRVAGVSALSMQTGTVQRCDDAFADPRTDAESCRILGVRSVVVLPLLAESELVGLFEIFSSRPAAFGDRDEQTLLALSQRVLLNLQKAAEPSPQPTRAAPQEPEQAEVQSPAPEQAPQSLAANTALAAVREEPTIDSRRPIDVITWALAAVVLFCAVGLIVLVGHRLAWSNSAHLAARKTQSVPSSSVAHAALSTTAQGQPSPVPSVTNSADLASRKAATDPRPRVARETTAVGGLRIFQNGKEVFRMPPSALSSDRASQERAVEPASAVESDPIVELPAKSAEDSIIYRVEPEYPDTARQQQIQGPVVISAHIGADGAVKETKIVSGNPVLTQAANDAVKQWRFRPHEVNGHFVEMQTQITLNFRLPQ